MTDLVERLRERGNGGLDEYGVHCELELEAADEIERLRAENLALHNLNRDAIDEIERLRGVLTEALGGTWHLALTAGHNADDR